MVTNTEIENYFLLFHSIKKAIFFFNRTKWTKKVLMLQQISCNLPNLNQTITHNNLQVVKQIIMGNEWNVMACIRKTCDKKSSCMGPISPIKPSGTQAQHPRRGRCSTKSDGGCHRRSFSAGCRGSQQQSDWSKQSRSRCLRWSNSKFPQRCGLSGRRDCRLMQPRARYRSRPGLWR